MTTSADWSKLPSDLVGKILGKLPLPGYFRFSSVCVSWNSAAKLYRPTPLWLMIPDDEDESSARFFSLSDKRTYKIRLPDPPIRRRMWIGSSYGWLITADEECEMHLLNPVTGTQIQLPSITTLPFIDAIRDPEGRITKFLIKEDHGVKFQGRNPKQMACYFFLKAVLSSAPSADGSGDFIVMLLHNPGSRMSFMRAGEKSWTPLQSPHGFKDIIVRDGSIYTVCTWGNVHAWDTTINGFTDVTRHARPPGPGGWSFRPRFVSASKSNSGCLSYLINSTDGRLLMLHRSQGRAGEGMKTRDLKVFRMHENKLEWREVKDMKDTVLLVGGNQSMSISAAEVPELTGNSIYFTEEVKGLRRDCRPWTPDIGIFDMMEKRVSSLDGLPSLPNWPLPIWITPTLFLNS